MAGKESTVSLSNLTFPEGYTSQRKTLGSGNYGSVFLARRDSDGALVAIKVLTSKREWNLEGLNYEAVSNLCGKGVICGRDKGEAFDKKGNHLGWYLIIDYVAEGMSGFDLVVSHEGRTQLNYASWSNLWEGFYQGATTVLDAVQSGRFVFRDIKPANMIVNFNSRTRGAVSGNPGVHRRVWLIDLGLGCTDSGCLHLAGTQTYMSPELFVLFGLPQKTSMKKFLQPQYPDAWAQWMFFVGNDAYALAMSFAQFVCYKCAGESFANTQSVNGDWYDVLNVLSLDTTDPKRQHMMKKVSRVWKTVTGSVGDPVGRKLCDWIWYTLFPGCSTPRARQAARYACLSAIASDQRFDASSKKIVDEYGERYIPISFPPPVEYTRKSNENLGHFDFQSPPTSPVGRRSSPRNSPSKQSPSRQGSAKTPATVRKSPSVQGSAKTPATVRKSPSVQGSAKTPATVRKSPSVRENVGTLANTKNKSLAISPPRSPSRRRTRKSPVKPIPFVLEKNTRRSSPPKKSPPPERCPFRPNQRHCPETVFEMANLMTRESGQPGLRYLRRPTLYAKFKESGLRK